MTSRNQERYEAFISYCSTDRVIAEAIDATAEGFGKSWLGRRQLRVVRDTTTLPVTSALWSAIERLLEGSRFFVIVASPAAAASDWVNREAEWWLRHRSRERILIVLVGGELRWDPEARAFLDGASAPLPPTLLTCFVEEPKYLDLRWAGTAAAPLARNERFLDAIAELAAPMLGISKDEVLGTHRRERRRRLSVAVTAALSIVGILVLGVVLRLVSGQASHLLVLVRNVLYHDRNAPVIDRTDLGTGAIATLKLLERLRLGRADFPALLAEAHERRGNAVGDPYGANAGNPAAAAASFEESLRTLDALSDADRATIPNRRIRVHALLGLAMAQFDLRQVEDAMQSLDGAIAEAQSMLATGDLSILHDLWIGHYRRGDVLVRAGGDGTTDLEASLAIAETLRRAAPSHEQYARNEAHSRGTLAAMYIRQDDLADARREVEKSIEVLVELERTGQSGRDLRSDLAVSQATLGHILTKQGKPREAAAVLARAVEAERRLAADDANDLQVRRNLASHAWLAAEAYAEIDDVPRSLAAYASAIDAAEAVAGRLPNGPEAGWLPDMWMGYADTLLAAGQLDEAATWYGRVLQNTRESEATHDNRTDAAQKLARLHALGVDAPRRDRR